LLSVIKNYQKVKIQDPDKAKSQFSQVRKMLMKDKDFQEYCNANDFYSDNKTHMEDPEENSSDISNLISPFKSILLSNSQTPPTISSLTPQDSASSLPTHPQPKSTGEIHAPKTTNLYPKKETFLPNNSQLPKTLSKDIPKPSQGNLKPPLTVKPNSRPIKKSSSESLSSASEESSERVDVRVTNFKSGAQNLKLGAKKSHYKSESSSSSSLEESSRTSSSHEDNDSESQDSSSSSDKKSKKSKWPTTTLRSIQLPKEKSSNKEKIKSPSQKILSLLNTADEDKLKQRLACVGPKRAQQIVKYREKNGPYSSIAELTQLEGIGSKWVKSFIESNQDI